MRIRRITYDYVACIFLCWAVFSCSVKKSQRYLPPAEGYTIDTTKRVQINDSLIFKGDNSLRKNYYGQYELLASGNPLSLGDNMGALTGELIEQQETIFFEKMEDFVPSRFKQLLVKKYLSWYNRDIALHITEEYKTEIFGLSRHVSNDLNFIEDRYLRTLYLHGAHDIGHALQDLAVVGCTSFAVWNENTEDGQLLIARNFDFYVNDDFARNKIISFIEPERGHKFMSVSWAGMIGVMSGMNEKGLTVTINAGKSDIPLLAKTPISLVTREILQYAGTIDEAISIARKREVFVSESILVGSDADNKAIIIEMSPEKFGIYEAPNSSRLICTNHFQSESFKDDKNNIKHIKESHSVYRYDRVDELLGEATSITPENAVDILRNKKGLKNDHLGYGNEKALNQLLAHHGVVFQPSKRRVWVSANPFQLGDFVAFQLDSVFANRSSQNSSLSNRDYLIAEDSFIHTVAFKNYQNYRIRKSYIENVIINDEYLTLEEITNFISLNSDFWESHYLIADYYLKKKYLKAALMEFEKALLLEIPNLYERNLIEEHIRKIKRKLHDS